MKTLAAVLALGATVLLSGVCAAFDKKGSDGKCADCHRLTREEAATLLRGMVDDVLAVEESPVRGLFVVDIAKDGKKFPVYIDFSKEFLISGQAIRLSTKENVTGTRYDRLNATTTDPALIPLGDALVMGNPSARKKVIVFSDPTCHFCAKLHEAIKTVVGRNADVAFHVLLYSRNDDPAVAARAKSVICGKSLKLLDDAYSGKELPPAACKTAAVEETARLARSLNMRGTPAMVMPDGRIVGGYRDADAILALLDEGSGARGEAGPKK